MSVDYHLTPAQLQRYEAEGYLVIRSFFDLQIAASLLERAKSLLTDLDLTHHPMTTFSTANDKHIGDDYFLTSGDKIRFFFEPDSIDPQTGQLNRPKEKAVNKIGHALHLLDPLFRDFSLNNQKIKNIAADIKAFVDPRVIQSMTITKQPSIGAPVFSHCDSTFLYTSPPSAVGLWFALERCTSSNGCLSFLPGSHKTNSIPERLVRVSEGGTKIVHNEESEGGGKTDWDAEEGWVVEECEIGDLVLIHGAVIHRSEKNLSSLSRFIYTFHLIEGEAKWDEKNWLQPTEGQPFSKLF